MPRPTLLQRRLTQAHHRSRYIKALQYRWWQRALFIVGGVTIGAAAVGFALLADLAQQGFAIMLGIERLAPLAAAPVGFALCVYLSRRFFPNAQGSGIPQAIAAHRSSDVAYRSKLVSLRAAAGKIVLTALGLLAGASTGREGPTVQLGAAIMLAAGKLSPRRQRGLIVAGAAAGVAAAFNTPLAGIMFGIEELTRSFERRTSSLIVATVIAAGFTSIALIGNYTYFGVASGGLSGAVTWVCVPICGILGGLSGGCFSRIVTSFPGSLPEPLRRWTQRRPVLFAAACGLIVAILGVLSGDSIYGTGYFQVKDALAGTTALTAWFAPLKLVATAICSISGIPGGIFSPSLAVGAGIGADIAGLFPGVDADAIMVLGMVAYLAGVVQAPITAFIIVTELIDDHSMLMPLMATAVIAHAVSRLVCRDGIYHVLARRYVQQRPPATG